MKLTERDLTVSYAARQLLLDRQDMDILDAIDHLVLLQAQESPSPYVALHTRLNNFKIEDLESVVLTESAVKGTFFRGTLHLVSSRMYPVVAGAWHRDRKNVIQWTENMGLSIDHVSSQLSDFLEQEQRSEDVRNYVRKLTNHQVDDHNWTIHYAKAIIPLIHTSPSPLYGKYGKYHLRHLPYNEDLTDPTIEMIRAYLRAYGPATRRDIASFTGLYIRQLKPALEQMDLVLYSDELGRDLLDVPNGTFVDTSVDIPPRLLSSWENAILGHDNRDRYVHYDTLELMKKKFAGYQSYMVDGYVGGSWKTEYSRGVATLRLTQLANHDMKDRDRLLEEALRTLQFVIPDAEEFQIEFQRHPELSD